MPNDGTTIITDIGHDVIQAAVKAKTKVRIARVSLGDGNGAKYNPGEGQTALRRELTQIPITRQTSIDGAVWRVTAEFAEASTPPMIVREIGFYDDQGRMIFLWAGHDIKDRHTGGIDYILEHVLALDRIKNGVVIIDAPSDTTFDLALVTAHATAQMQLEQLRQGDAIRSAHGNY